MMFESTRIFGLMTNQLGARVWTRVRMSTAGPECKSCRRLFGVKNQNHQLNFNHLVSWSLVLWRWSSFGSGPRFRPGLERKMGPLRVNLPPGLGSLGTGQLLGSEAKVKEGCVGLGFGGLGLRSVCQCQRDDRSLGLTVVSGARALTRVRRVGGSLRVIQVLGL